MRTRWFSPEQFERLTSAHHEWYKEQGIPIGVDYDLGEDRTTWGEYKVSRDLAKDERDHEIWE